MYKTNNMKKEIILIAAGKDFSILFYYHVICDMMNINQMNIKQNTGEKINFNKNEQYILHTHTCRKSYFLIM